MFVDDKPFDLLEHRAVRRVVVVSVNFAGNDDTNGRFFGGHRASLHRACVRTKQEIVGDIEGILHIARGVILRNVEKLEVKVIAFDFRTFLDLEPEPDKRIENLVFDFRQRMQRPEFRFPGSVTSIYSLLMRACFSISLNSASFRQYDLQA